MPTFMFPGATSAEDFAAAVDSVDDAGFDYCGHEYRPNDDGTAPVLVVVGKRRPGRPRKETRA